MFQIQKAVLKNTRRWSVYAVKTPKTYGYIRELQARIVGKRLSSGVGMPNTRTQCPDDPRRFERLKGTDCCEQQPPDPPTHVHTPPLCTLCTTHIQTYQRLSYCTNCSISHTTPYAATLSLLYCLSHSHLYFVYCIQFLFFYLLLSVIIC